MSLHMVGPGADVLPKAVACLSLHEVPTSDRTCLLTSGHSLSSCSLSRDGSVEWTHPSLVPLNRHTGTRPLFLVHPVTGVVSQLEKLGQSLPLPCIGLQQTPATPTSTLQHMASCYKSAILEACPDGPVLLGGYSFGAIIAFHIALQLQEDGKEVPVLIMLDGAPAYVQAQIDYVTASILASSHSQPDPRQVKVQFEASAILWFMRLYGSVPSDQRDVIWRHLSSLESREDRVRAAVHFMLEGSLSSQDKQTKWQQCARSCLRKRSVGLREVTTEIMRMRREQKAKDFLSNIDMVKNASLETRKFQGNIHLLRVQTLPDYAPTLPVDYGLNELCTGHVTVKMFSGSHDTFITDTAVRAVSRHVQSILGKFTSLLE